jgi:N-acetylglucosaminyldiphosphoundecaprenol N-acetyl-beta-D-mannosaminyltransferase
MAASTFLPQRYRHPISPSPDFTPEHASRARGDIPARTTTAPAQTAAPPALPRRAEIIGIPLAISAYEEVVDWMSAMIAVDARGYMTAAAVNLIMSAQEESETMAAVRGATLAVPDGMPLVWALRALGHRQATRIYGPDLMLAFCERAARDGTPIYLYGGRDEAALALLRRRLQARFPGLRIVGGCSPPFRELTPAEEQRAIADINGSGAQVVWVGTGQPKQELWMHRMRPRLRAPLLVGVGAAFDFHAGLVPQAPRWMQRAGLEWSYRLAREPKRLWRRYARYNPRFVAGFAQQCWRARR